MFVLYNLIYQEECLMKITRAYQFRLYPTHEQEILIHKTFGCTRFLYNQMLDEKKKNVTLSKFDNS